MILELLNENVVVLEMGYDQGLHTPVSVTRLVAPEYAPPSCVGLDGSISLSDVAWWWRHRGIPASRPRLERLLESCGVDEVEELVERALGLSLSDRYWVRPKDSELVWSEVNFFDNPFSDDLGRLTADPLGGPGSGACSDDDLCSPNSTVLGNVPKRWVRSTDGGTRLLKAGFQLFDQDVRNELVACRLYERAMPPEDFVSYTVESDGNRELASCPNMLSDGEELVSAADLLRRHRRDRGLGSYASVLEALCESGLGESYLSTCLSRIFSLDFLLAGFDRHTGNFGLVRDCRTLRYLRFAPTYDSGNSLWCDKRRLEKPSDYEYLPRPFLGRQGESGIRQLRFFTDYEWLPEADLDGWREDALQILAGCPNMPESRLASIDKGLRHNIELFERHVDRVERICPSPAAAKVQNPPLAQQASDLNGMSLSDDQNPHRRGAEGV